MYYSGKFESGFVFWEGDAYYENESFNIIDPTLLLIYNIDTKKIYKEEPTREITLYLDDGSSPEENLKETSNFDEAFNYFSSLTKDKYIKNKVIKSLF